MENENNIDQPVILNYSKNEKFKEKLKYLGL